MSEPFIGEIRIVGFTFAPRGWALCNGQLLSIAQNTALFSLLGTTYGGNGTSTFALPDLQGRFPMHFGTGPGLTPRTQGEVSGTETVTLLTTQMPAHTHLATVTLRGNSGDASADTPQANVPARAEVYSAGAANVDLNASAATASVQTAGGDQPHTNMPPYLVLNFIIALEGIFPSRS
jgi:microcystin-dependent protein